MKLLFYDEAVYSGAIAKLWPNAQIRVFGDSAFFSSEWLTTETWYMDNTYVNSYGVENLVENYGDMYHMDDIIVAHEGRKNYVLLWV